MSSKQHRRFGAEKKALIVRRHLAEKVPVSDLADEFGVQPSQIHTWVKQVLDQAEKAFERSDGSSQQLSCQSSHTRLISPLLLDLAVEVVGA